MGIVIATKKLDQILGPVVISGIFFFLATQRRLLN